MVAVAASVRATSVRERRGVVIKVLFGLRFGVIERDALQHRRPCSGFCEFSSTKAKNEIADA